MKIGTSAAVLFVWFTCAVAQDERAWNNWQREYNRLSNADTSTDHIAADISLEAYADYAQRNNPGINAALERWRAALERVKPARAWADPRLTLGHFMRSVETRVGPQEQRLSLMQSVPWFDELDLRGQVELANAEVECWRYEMARAQVRFEVVDAYFAYYYLERAIAVTESNMQLMAYLEEVAHTRYRGGTGQHGVLIKAQVELGRLEDRVFSMRDQLRPVASRLNAVLGRRANMAISVVDSPMVRVFSETQLRDLLRVDNPELKTKRAIIERERLSAELAGKSARPDLALGIDYIRTGVAGPIADSGKDPLVLMATLNLPFGRDKYRAQVRAANARYRAAQKELLDRENHLLAELENALYEWRESQRKKELYRDNLLPKAEQAFNVTQQAFATGQSSFLDLVDAQRALLEFQLAYEKALVDGARFAANIDRLVGRSPSFNNEINAESNRENE